MGASSQIISLVALSNSVSGELSHMLQTENSSTFMGIAKSECAVLPPGNKVAAIPLDATVKTMRPLALIDYARAFHK